VIEMIEPDSKNAIFFLVFCFCETNAFCSQDLIVRFLNAYYWESKKLAYPK